MRVTNNMMTSNYQRQIHANANRLYDVENQLSTGKLIHRASQDPFGATRVMTFTTEITRYEQYKRNAEDVEGYMDVTDGALSQVNDQLKRVKELALQANNGTYSPEDRQQMAEEIENIMESMVVSLNTTIEDKYAFGGQVTDKAPFELIKDATGKISVTYHGNDISPQIEISKGVYVNKSIPGSDLLSPTNGRNIFEAISDLAVAVRNNDVSEINSISGDVTSFEDTVLMARGKTGAIQKRMEMTIEKIDSEIANSTKLLSKYGDTDYSERIIEWKALDGVYQASLQIGSSILKPSLLDFLQ